MHLTSLVAISISVLLVLVSVSQYLVGLYLGLGLGLTLPGLSLNLGPKHGCIIKILLDTALTTDVNKYSLASAIDANKDGGSS